MARKTIEYKGEFKVDIDFTMTSDEGISNEVVEEVIKLMHNDMAKEIEECIDYWFDEDGVDNLKVTCKKIDTATNIIDNTSEQETIQEEDKTESGEE